MKDLLIVESPTKARTINKFLGSKYLVVASKGHIRDLPKSELGVDVDNNYKPKYVIPPKAKKNVKALKEAYKKANKVYLATDEDREGEAISWHISYILKNTKGTKKKDLFRITFHEITNEAIEKALKNPGKINTYLVNAQQARRVLDRLVGYKLSPLLWKKIQFGLSAGRVQSVALRLIVERELEREKFKSQDYFLIEGSFEYNNTVFKSSLYSILGEKLIQKSKDKEGTVISKFLLTNEAHAQKILNDIQSQSYFISKVVKKEKSRSTFPPFTTSLLQQAGSNMLGFSAKRTMQAAQKLYEKGLITYHRTDSFNLSQKFLKESEKFIIHKFGKEYYQKNIFKKKAKGAQEAHEAIRPTFLKKEPSTLKALSKDEQFIYELIYTRAVATQMSPIKLLSTSVDISSKNNKYLFRTTGQQVLFKGWAKAYSLLSSFKYNPLSQDTILPDLQENKDTTLKEVKLLKKSTQPPARYSEASLIKVLEKYGIGRPSTYAPTISTLISRRYVIIDSKYLLPTDLGKVVIKLLLDNFKEIIDYDFTAKVEKDLDEIALGKKDWPKVVDAFYKPFIKKVESSTESLSRKDYKVLGKAPKDLKCPKCGGGMLIKLGRNGKFYTCANFPDCDGLRDMEGKTEEDYQNKSKTKDFKKLYEPAPKTEDGRDYVLKKGRFGEFWAHPDYPKVKQTQPLKLKRQALIKLYGEPPKTEDGRDYVLKKGRFGEFWSHPDYPKVKDIQKIKKSDSKNTH